MHRWFEGLLPGTDGALLLECGGSTPPSRARTRDLAVAKSDLLATIQRFFGPGGDAAKHKAS